MAQHEYSSARLGEIAARRLHDPDPEVAALAGSVLTQLRNREPKSSLADYLCFVGDVPGAHGVYNKLARPNAFEGSILEEYSKVDPVDSILGQYGKRVALHESAAFVAQS